MAPFNVGDRMFPSKADAQRAIQKILNRKTHSVPMDEDDHSFLYDLMLMHPEVNEKLGGGLGWFKSEPDGYGNRCFVHVDTEDREIIWSYLACLKPKNPKTQVGFALREAVDYQIKPLRRWQHQVDHTNPGGFADLADRFIAHCGGLDYVETGPSPHGHGLVMTNLAQIFLWQQFHERFAELELVTVEEHKARTAARKKEARV